MKNPGKVRAWTYGTKSPSRSGALCFIDSAKFPSTKIDGSLVNFRPGLSNRLGRPRRIIDNGLSKELWSDCEHVHVIRTSRVLSPDGAWPDRWLSGMIEMIAEPAIRPSSIRTEDPTCANHVDVLTVRSVFLRMSIVNILRGIPCRLEGLRLKFTNEPSIFVDGGLAESIKRSASDRLGDLVP